MVFNILHEGRERKLRSAKVMMTGRKVEKLVTSSFKGRTKRSRASFKSQGWARPGEGHVDF